MTRFAPRGRLRRAMLVPGLLPILAAPVAAASLTACGSQPSQLVVSLAAVGNNDSAKPGDTLTYTLSVVNKGPGAATSVHLAVDLPADFHYQATPNIDHDIVGAPRTAVTDPQPKATSPAWGTWDLASPTTNADGTARLSNVDITFTTTAGGDPGDYRLQPRVSSDQDTLDGTAVAIHLNPAPQLAVDVSTDRTSVDRGKDVLYRVTVDNFGTGPASKVGILVTLPQGLSYLRTEQIQGNASRDSPVDPVEGTLEAFFGGFTIPAKTTSEPGSLIIVVRAHCAFCTGGRYTVTVQVTDSDGLAAQVANTAPIDVTAPGLTPQPPNQGGPPPQPTPAPAPAPSP
jgi:uncharacterized repeat protein (TIGR01451 family)